MHRLWSNFESVGGGHIMRVKRARGRIAHEEGEDVGGGMPLPRYFDPVVTQARSQPSLRGGQQRVCEGP